MCEGIRCSIDAKITVKLDDVVVNVLNSWLWFSLHHLLEELTKTIQSENVLKITFVGRWREVVTNENYTRFQFV